jgi:hypothetical protein
MVLFAVCIALAWTAARQRRGVGPWSPCHLSHVQMSPPALLGTASAAAAAYPPLDLAMLA